MRLMMIVKCTVDSEAGRSPDPRLMAATAGSAKELMRSG
jgi:hypothetical protein